MKFIYSPTSDTAYVKMFFPYWIDFDNREARVIASSTDPNISFGELRTTEFLPLSTGDTYSRFSEYGPNLMGRSGSLLHTDEPVPGLVPINLEINNPGAGEEDISPSDVVAKTSEANLDFPYLLSTTETVWENVYDEEGNKRRVVVKSIDQTYDDDSDTITASVVIAEVHANGIISTDFETYPLITYPAAELHTVVAVIPVDRYFLVAGWHEATTSQLYHSLVDVDGTVHDLTSGGTTIPTSFYTYHNYADKPKGLVAYDRDSVYVLTGVDYNYSSVYKDVYRISISDKSVTKITDIPLTGGGGIQYSYLPLIEDGVYNMFVYDGSLNILLGGMSGRGIYRYDDDTGVWNYAVNTSLGFYANHTNSKTFLLPEEDTAVVITSSANNTNSDEFDLAFVDLVGNSFSKIGIPYGQLSTPYRDHNSTTFVSVGSGVYMLTAHDYYAFPGAKIPF